MPAELHETSLIALLAVGFVLALLFGLGANILKVSPIVGYLVAGICVGPVHRAQPHHVRGNHPAQSMDRGASPTIAHTRTARSGSTSQSIRSSAGLENHAIIVGYGRVGGAIGPVLKEQGLAFVVIERDHLMLATAQAQAIATVEGDAASSDTLHAAGIGTARLLVVATPDSFLARRIVEVARELNPAVDVVVRTHSESEFQTLEALGAGRVVMGERELARGMLQYALRSLGVPRERAQALVGRDAQVNPEGT